jgi:hypothetical protein
MAGSDRPAVTLERRAHRDAVVRLREAYRRLARRRPSLPAAPAPTLGAPRAPVAVSEVSDD